MFYKVFNVENNTLQSKLYNMQKLDSFSVSLVEYLRRKLETKCRHHHPSVDILLH